MTSHYKNTNKFATIIKRKATITTVTIKTSNNNNMPPPTVVASNQFIMQYNNKHTFTLIHIKIAIS